MEISEMANPNKHKPQDQTEVAQTAEAAPAAPTEAAPAVAATPAVGGQGKKIMLPNGEARVDYIKRRFYKEGAKRGQIAKELSEMTGVKVPYQIVFASTKPEKPAAAAPADGAAQPAAAEGATA